MTIHHIVRPLALKALDQGGTFHGYGSVFNTLDCQNEIVEAGAFTRSLARWRESGLSPAMLWMHDPTQPIGLWVSLREDRNGLAVEGRLALGTQKGQEAYELLKMKALTGLSIGYRVVSSRVDRVRKARVLTDIDLFEISLVTFPANESARIGDVKAPRFGAALKVETARPWPTLHLTDAEKTRAIVARLNAAARTLKQNPRRI